MDKEKSPVNYDVFRVNLQTLMERNGLNKTMLADKLGMALPTLSRYLTGSRKPDLDYVVTIANYFGVSLDWLLGLDSGVSDPLPQEILSVVSAYTVATEDDKRVIQAILGKYSR